MDDRSLVERIPEERRSKYLKAIRLATVLVLLPVYVTCWITYRHGTLSFELPHQITLIAAVVLPGLYGAWTLLQFMRDLLREVRSIDD